MSRHILVIGAGSVGKRHMRNLAGLGCSLSAVDPRQDRLEEAAAEASLQGAYSNLDEALQFEAAYDGAVIASPPVYHVQQCLRLAELGIPVLLEKPVSPTYEEAAQLGHLADNKLLLGYSYRWWPPLHDLKSKLEKGMIGKPLHAKFVMSAHLADWHPWEPYQDFFMASKKLGGGALLDESHFIDLMLWFFGMPQELFAKVEKLSSLELDTDDNVDILAQYDNGLRVSIHLDLYGRPHEKFISVTGEQGTLRWSFEPNAVEYSGQIGHEWETVEYSCERNDMFVGTAKEFLKVIDGEQMPSCTIHDGIAVLQVVESCRTSSDRKMVVKL